MTGTGPISVGRQCLFIGIGGGRAYIGGAPGGSTCWRFPGLGLTDMTTDESAAEEGDGAEVGALLFLGRFGLVCGPAGGEARRFLGPFNVVGKGSASMTTTGGADEGPGKGPRAFFFWRALVVAAGGAPGSAGPLEPEGGSSRAWRSGLPTTGVCFASNLI